MANLDIPFCFWLWKWSLLCLLRKSKNRMSVILAASKTYECRTAFGANHLPILWEASHALHSKYERSYFYLGRPLYTQNKAHNISLREVQNFASEIWRSVHHTREMCQDDLNTSLAWRKYNKRNSFTQHTSKKKGSTTLATYHNAVRHTTSSEVFLKQNLLFVSYFYVSIHVWAGTVWLSVFELTRLLSLLCLNVHAHTMFKT